MYIEANHYKYEDIYPNAALIMSLLSVWLIEERRDLDKSDTTPIFEFWWCVGIDFQRNSVSIRI